MVFQRCKRGCVACYATTAAAQGKQSRKYSLRLDPEYREELVVSSHLPSTRQLLLLERLTQDLFCEGRTPKKDTASASDARESWCHPGASLQDHASHKFGDPWSPSQFLEKNFAGGSYSRLSAGLLDELVEAMIALVTIISEEFRRKTEVTPQRAKSSEEFSAELASCFGEQDACTPFAGDG